MNRTVHRHELGGSRRRFATDKLGPSSMDAEFIAVSGPLLGERFPLREGETRLGRAPTSEIHLAESEVAWEHCTITLREGRYRLTDRRSGFGTYVNGMRVAEYCLEEGDQVSVGETVLVFRQEEAAAREDSQQHTLLRACSLMFLFRALATSQSAAHRATLEAQILRLAGDLTGCTGGAVLLGRNADELRAAAADRADLPQLAAQAVREGAVVDGNSRTIALPLHASGAVAGVLVACFPPEEAANLADHRDTLSAIGTLAAAALDAARDMERLRTENALLVERLGGGDSGIIGESAAIGRVKQMIARLAPSETSVLILGESGTGKELVARALHHQSPRAAKPFVAINCAALTDTLLESELFGHEKGAFTGAVGQKKGKLEVAAGGTVFLDENGEMAQLLQAKLLRVLQERQMERVGGTQTVKLDIRMVAATNRDLEDEVRKGNFRQDLYYRLNVVTLKSPPLRDRPEDILPLANHFARRFAGHCGRPITGIAPATRAYLQSYSWPGNVRELENAIERAVVLGSSDTILPEDLPENIREGSPPAEVSTTIYDEALNTAKRQVILKAFDQVNYEH